MDVERGSKPANVVSQAAAGWATSFAELHAASTARIPPTTQGTRTRRVGLARTHERLSSTFASHHSPPTASAPADSHEGITRYTRLQEAFVTDMWVCAKFRCCSQKSSVQDCFASSPRNSWGCAEVHAVWILNLRVWREYEGAQCAGNALDDGNAPTVRHRSEERTHAVCVELHRAPIAPTIAA
jgi:hypothetical protein